MYKDILMPIDLEDDHSWKQALPNAIDMARNSGATLHVMTVVPDFGMSIVGQYFPVEARDKMAKAILKDLHAFVDTHIPDDIKVQHIVGEGKVYEAILSMAKKTKTDLIIMASHRPELKDYLLGPNSARVVRHANCSVLVVRG